VSSPKIPVAKGFLADHTPVRYVLVAAEQEQLKIIQSEIIT
jgi:hypothetical protein